MREERLKTDMGSKRKESVSMHSGAEVIAAKKLDERDERLTLAANRLRKKVIVRRAIRDTLAQKDGKQS